MRAMTVWSLLEECVSQLDEPFRRSEIVGWFRRHRPEVNETTLAAHIQAATANATNRAQNNALGARAALLIRIDHGLYVRARPGREDAITGQPDGIEVPDAVSVARGAEFVLIGCVRTKGKNAAAASELFISPLFERRRRYAVGTGLPWFILSAKFGLLAADDVIGPYDMYLADQSPAYKKAWGKFVVAQLEHRLSALQGRTVEIHAGAAYVEPLRAPLSARGARLLLPLSGLRQGEQLAWYDKRGTRAKPITTSPVQLPHPVDADGRSEAYAQQLIRLLADRSKAVSSADWIAQGRGGRQGPGLYSWWVDDQGAADLTRGLGLPVAPGLIYAGQAGATRWPSGKRSQNTLWGRIAGMHLGGAAEFSTFRRTLAAILRSVLPLDTEDDPRLSAWISEHLRVIAIAVPDADRLGRIESAVLEALDPPLNLVGRPRTDVRIQLGRMRAAGKSSTF